MNRTVLFTIGAVVALALVAQQQAKAQELIIEQHSDLSITLKTLNGGIVKNYPNVEALAGANGLADIIEQMELWN